MPMFENLKTQLLLALSIIVLLFIGQEFVSNQSQSLFLSGLSTNNKLAYGVVQVKNLEKDVNDLQRNVLIYKDNHSSSALKRFDDILVQVEEKLTVAKAFVAEYKISEQSEDTISSMYGHIDDYKENFNSVVLLIEKKNTIFNQQLTTNIQSLKNYVKAPQEQVKSLTADHVNQLDSLLTLLQLSLYKYYLDPTKAENISNFRTHYQAIIELDSVKQLPDSEQSKLLDIMTDFSLLTQVIRNYNYLVNVVMSGSANEFLYLAKSLSATVLEHLERNNTSLNTAIASSVFRGNIMFILGISITLMISFIIVTRIILPIQNVTKLFSALALNKNVDQQFDTDRKDEVGKLLEAANIFRIKNEQTNSLLKKEQKLNDELAYSKHKAEQATHSKSIFLANMSHEIRTPMNGIIGLLDLLRLKPLGKEEREYVDKIRYSSNILMSVINDILDFSKIEAGKLDIENVAFDPIVTIENVIEAITVKAAEKNLNVFASFPANLPRRLIGDPVRLTQILLNIGNNAIKFTHSGFLAFKVIAQPQKQQTKLSIEVSDTGIGISESQLQEIFKDFTQAEASTTRQFGGTGLGLSISQQLAKLMNGTITVASELDKGSTFTVSIPFDTVTNHQINEVSFESAPHLLLFNVGQHCTNITDNFQAQGIKTHEINISTESLNVPVEQHYDGVVINLDTPLNTQQTASIKAIENTLSVAFCRKPYNAKLKSLSLTFPDAFYIDHPILPSKINNLISKLQAGYTRTDDSADVPSQDSLNETTQYSGHVLLVEDNAINQMVAGKVLQGFGLTYDLAEDGEQAFIKVTNSPNYDLVFMDIQMPILDGYQATQKIRQKGLDEVVICGLSANAMKSDIEKGMAAGMNEYITKPISRDDVKTILEKYLPVCTS